MKTLAIIAAASAMATAAQAVTVTSFPGAPDAGFAATGQVMVVDFEAPNAAGYSWTAGTINIATGNIPGAAAPANSATGTKYGFVSKNIAPSFATLSTPLLKSISVYWGSIDPGNSVSVLGAGGAVLRTVAGNQLPAYTGNQTLPATNRRVFFTAAPGQVITGLTFRATNVAFEFDSIAAAAVPEPASWAMLIAGFAMVGAASRRRGRAAMAA